MADKIDIVLELLTDFRQETNDNFKNMNGRVRDLEAWKWKLAGALGVLAGIVAIFR